VHVLIATTGVLPPTPAAELCSQLLGQDGKVTVMTVIQIPRTFLEAMDDDERRSFLDTEEWETRSAEAKAARYLEERGRRVVEPLVAALTARGHEVDVRYVEGSDPADAIIATADDVGASMIMMGATRRLFTEQAWTSVSARVMERTQCPLVLVPGLKPEDTGEMPKIAP
jgi:nucleotide-binding universal stress UspA family protein